MPYTIHRSGKILTMLVIEPTMRDVPRGLAEIQRGLDGGGISEVHMGFDEAAWQTGWAVATLTALETTMNQLGITFRVLGRDARKTPQAPNGPGGSSLQPDAPAEPSVREPGPTGRAPARPAG